jgi:hypothetical protein
MRARFPRLQGVLRGSRLYLFGGEDGMRRPLAQLLCLDLAAMTWSAPETTGGLRAVTSPPP